MRKFHCYIYGRHFRLLTDHKPLLSIFGSKVGIAAYSANRLRWELVLLAYDFVIEYRRSTHFGQAGALSRLIASKNLPEDEDIVIAKIEQDVRAVQGDVIRHFPVTKEDIQRMTEEDPELELVVNKSNKLEAATHDDGQSSWLDRPYMPSTVVLQTCLSMKVHSPWEHVLWFHPAKPSCEDAAWGTPRSHQNEDAGSEVRLLARNWQFVSNSGTQFTVMEFQDYCQNNGVQHMRSPHL